MSYLSEKLFIPMNYGAIPVYRGNGHQWFDQLTVNHEAFLDRANYKSDEELGHAIVNLLRNSTRMLQIQREPVFKDESVAYKRANFYLYPEEIGKEGIPEIYEFVRSSERFARVLNKSVLTYSIPYTRVKTKAQGGILKVLFGADKVVRRDDQCADVEFDWCCP